MIKSLLIYLCILFSLKANAQDKQFFISKDSFFCILLDKNLIQSTALDTTTLQEFFVFKNKKNEVLNYFIIVQNQQIKPSTEIGVFKEKDFPDYDIKNAILGKFGKMNCIIFDSPYKGFPQYSSRGIIIEGKTKYFILLLTYRKNNVDVDLEFNNLLNSLIINW